MCKAHTVVCRAAVQARYCEEHQVQDRRKIQAPPQSPALRQDRPGARRPASPSTGTARTGATPHIRLRTCVSGRLASAVKTSLSNPLPHLGRKALRPPPPLYPPEPIYPRPYPLSWIPTAWLAAVRGQRLPAIKPLLGDEPGQSRVVGNRCRAPWSCHPVICIHLGDHTYIHGYQHGAAACTHQTTCSCCVAARYPVAPW